MTTETPVVSSEALLDQVTDPGMREAIRQVLREHRDNRGRSRGEIFNSPKTGSHKYPWGKGR